jgi:hypothetical protein
MLDVHPPHHAANSWRDFFSHIATIVIGLLIAVGLEQTVEYFHHRHQVHQLEEALREEGIENREVIGHDIAWADRAIAGADADILALQAPASPKATPVVLHPVPRDIFAPGNNAWLTMRDSGLLGIAPRELVENYWKVYYTQEVTIMEIRAVGADGDRVLAQVSLHNSPAGLPSTERDALLVASPTIGRASSISAARSQPWTM